MPQLFSNNGVATLASSATNVATSLSLASGKGALFPNPSAPDYFIATLTNPGETLFEIVKVTARATDVLTVVRAQEGTTALAWSTGDKCELRITAGSFALAPLSAPAYTYTGTLTAEPLFFLAPPQPSMAAGVVADYSGKWAVLLVVPNANTGLTGITFTDLQGFAGAGINPSQLLALTTLSFPALTTCVGSFGPNNLPALTTLSAPALVAANTVGPTTLNALTTLSFPVLTTCSNNYSPNTLNALTTHSIPLLATVGVNFSPGNMPVLTTLSAPALVTVGQQFVPTSMALLTTLSIPLLATVGNNFAPTSMPVLTTLSAPALVTVNGTFAPANMAALTTFSFALLANIVGAFNPNSLTTLTSVTLPAIVTLGGGISIISGMGALTTFTLGSTLKSITGNVVISSCALNVTAVNALLVSLAALDGTGGTTAFSSRTVTITGTSATPTGVGVTAKATLVARSCTVTTN